MKQPITQMIRTIPIALCLLLILFPVLSHAQDLHYTNYAAAPQVLNPAKIGGFEGTYKVGAIYRDQFSSFFNQGFKSQGVFAEMNLPVGLKDHHWVSIGVALDNDQSGDLSFGSTRVGGTVAYHWALDKKYKNVLTLGLQYNLINRTVDPSLIRTNATLTGATTDPDQNLLQQYQSSQPDFNLGLNFRSKLNKKTSFELGTGVYHFLASRDPGGPTFRDIIPLRINVHTGLKINYNKKIGFEPRLYYSRAGQASDLAAQFVTSYKLSESTVDLGLGYRIGDALEFIMGYHLKGWHVFGAYDMTVSSASEYNNSVGGFEIGVYKILIKHPKAEIKTLKICPRL